MKKRGKMLERIEKSLKGKEVERIFFKEREKITVRKKQTNKNKKKKNMKKKEKRTQEKIKKDRKKAKL